MYAALETPSRPPPPFMANAILNFHFHYLTPYLINTAASVHECFLLSKIIEGLNLFNSLTTICLPSDPLLVMVAIMVMVRSNFNWSDHYILKSENVLFGNGAIIKGFNWFVFENV